MFPVIIDFIKYMISGFSKFLSKEDVANIIKNCKFYYDKSSLLSLTTFSNIQEQAKEENGDDSVTLIDMSRSIVNGMMKFSNISKASNIGVCMNEVAFFNQFVFEDCYLAGIATIINKVRNFNDFNEDNNPYGEKDFGAFEFKGKKIFWKIDYYDRELLYLSPDACNPKLTNRVLTIMYANEY